MDWEREMGVSNIEETEEEGERERRKEEQGSDTRMPSRR